ncbi:MAG: hypothetical protein N2C14_18795, partial [Planctomycetales bacterium]
MLMGLKESAPRRGMISNEWTSPLLESVCSHALAAGANTQLANLLVERGKILAEQAVDPNTLSEEKKTLTEEARTLYKEAEQVFIKLEKHFSDEHKKYPKLLKDPKEIEARDQVRR